jgi:putative DNA primase/helicase
VKIPTTVSAAAEYYAASFGWRVFPLYEMTSAGICSCKYGAECTTPGKHPRISTPKDSGKHPATSDLKQVKEWWRKWPKANIGVWLENSNLIVLDIDRNEKKDGYAGLEEIMAYERVSKIPETLACVTPSGGRHLYFQFCEGVPNRANALGPGLDTWHSAHYVIVPPSNHVKGIYAWENGIAIPAIFPEWLKPKPRGVDTKRGRGRPAKERLNPNDSDDVERLKYALKHVDATNRDTWVLVGFALARAFKWSDVGFAIYDAWSATAHNYDPAKTHEQYYKQSKIIPPDPITTASIFEWAKKHPDYSPPVIVRDLDHYKVGQAVVAFYKDKTGEDPVHAHGSLWLVKDGLWLERSLEAVAMDVGRMFGGGKFVKRTSDFRSIAQVAAQLCEDQRFFETAAVGIAGQSGFWRVTDDGKIRQEELTAAHRQRLRVAEDPDPKKKPVMFLKLLREAFEGHEPEAQTQLMQQLVGCAITRSLWRHMIAGLLLGASKSGKSTVLTFLKSVFSPDQISATSPQRWDQEYYVADLAGKALNTVGELDSKHPIPGGAFKQVVGRDVIQGRHPTHRPFTFVCQAAHFFNCNVTPPTNDRSDAFFNRWRIIYFANSKPPPQRIGNLDQQLIAKETGAFLWWALMGAAQVMKSGDIMETNTHRERLARWRQANNSAIAFLRDQRECKLDAEAGEYGQQLFERYRAWAVSAGLVPFGRNGFYENIDAAAGEIGILPKLLDHQQYYEGVKLTN